MTKDEALQKALDALGPTPPDCCGCQAEWQIAITAIKAAQHMTDEDDDTQAFEPDWADFQEGRKVGRAEAFEQIAEKFKEMPWENDTKDSFLIWLKEQNT